MAATAESLNQEIATQTTLFNELRVQDAGSPAVEEAKKKLGELKKALGALTKAAGGGKDAKKKERLLLKTAKVNSIDVISLDIKLTTHVPDGRARETMAQAKCSAVNTSSESSKTASRNSEVHAWTHLSLSAKISSLESTVRMQS